MFESIDKPNKTISVERQANFENLDTDFLVSRLHDPIIRGQIVDIRYNQQLERQKIIKEGDWVDYLPDGWNGSERFKLKLDKKSGKVISEEDLEIERQTEISREGIEQILERELEEIERQTDIDFTTNGPTSAVMPLNWVVPWTGVKATSRQKSIIEAPEKGHGIRDYNHLTSDMRKAFDVSKANFSEEDYELSKKDIRAHTDKPIDWDENKPFEVAKEEYLNEYLFTGMEIAERMSQLKNYFGFRGAEQFTHEHLAYAKEHYIEDTKMDNSMRLFFEAITPETEDEFLQVINNYGI